ncbi:MAG: hypothetical protein HQL93_07685 [Magnetococcales bacterium]|nr:hypothetical protein [Magnetococcales bacterium]
MMNNKKLTFLHIEQMTNPSLLEWVKRQILGIAILIAGIILAIPGVPGPGIVLIALAFLLIDFPGKNKILLKLGKKRWFRVMRVVVRKKLKILLVLPKGITPAPKYAPPHAQ